MYTYIYIYTYSYTIISHGMWEKDGMGSRSKGHGIVIGGLFLRAFVFPFWALLLDFCFPASLLFCLSASLFSAFPASLLL